MAIAHAQRAQGLIPTQSNSLMKLARHVAFITDAMAQL
jgi:hypothetical protein